MNILRSSVIYVGLGFLPMGINFLLSPLYSYILTPEQNALLGQAAIFQSLLFVFLTLSIDSAFSRYFFDYRKDEAKLKEYMSSIVIFIILISTIVFLIFYFFGDSMLYAIQKNNKFTYSKYGVWIFATTFSIVIQSIFLAYFRNREHIKGFAIISLSFFFLALAGTLTGLLVFKAGAYGSIVGRAVTFLFLAFLFLFIFFKRAGFFFNTSYLKESLQYSVPIVPYVILMSLFGNIDRLMVELYFTLADLGIYNFAFLMSGAVAVFITAGQNVVTPIVYKLWSEDVHDTNRLAQVFKWYHFVCAAALCLGLAIAVFFTELFIAPGYRSILNYIGPLFLAYIFRLYYIMFLDSLFYFKKTRWISLITLVSFIIGLLSNIILIPRLGILGISISVLIINLAQAIGAYLQIIWNKINRGFYSTLSNGYTILILLSYFSLLFIFRLADKDVKYLNIVPFVVTALYSVYFVYKNKQLVGERLNSLLAKKGRNIIK